MSKFKLITKTAKTIGEFMAPELLTEATKMVNKQVEKRSDYIKIPNVRQLTIDEAKSILNQFDLIVSTILLDPDIKLANARPNSVLKVTPHSALAVPPKTLVKIFYIDEATALESRRLQMEFDKTKAIKKQAQTEAITKLGNSVKQAPKNIKDKIHFKPRKK